MWRLVFFGHCHTSVKCEFTLCLYVDVFPQLPKLAPLIVTSIWNVRSFVSNKATYQRLSFITKLSSCCAPPKKGLLLLRWPEACLSKNVLHVDHIDIYIPCAIIYCYLECVTMRAKTFLGSAYWSKHSIATRIISQMKTLIYCVNFIWWKSNFHKFLK